MNDLRETQDGLTLLIISLTCIATGDVQLIIDNKMDILGVLGKYEAEDSNTSADGADYRQTAFTLQCYRDLHSKLSDSNAQLVTELEEKDEKIAQMENDVASVATEEETKPETAMVGRVMRAED